MTNSPSVAAAAQHPITPPPELVQQWIRERDGLEHLATQAARWGADQELEACCADIHTVYGKGQADWLRSMRRPKPPSLKEKALAILDDSYRGDLCNNEIAIIRRALEQLND